jgi:hypothetical protein
MNNRMGTKKTMRIMPLKHPTSRIFPARPAASRENPSAQPAQPVSNLSPKHSHTSQRENRTLNCAADTNGTTTAKTRTAQIAKRSD